MKIVNHLWALLLLLSALSCSSVFYQPTKKHYLEPRKQLGLDYLDFTFDSKDGTRLNGWFFPARTKVVKGTVIQFHGNAQNLSSHFLNLIWLSEQGYNLFVFDYRGYGKSAGTSDQKGVYDDALAALDKAWELHESHGKGQFVVFGQSLGGIIALRSVPDWKGKENVSLLVLDSTFASYQDIAFYKTSHNWLLFLVSPLSYLVVSDEYAADKVWKKVKAPTLVIVGQKDDVIPQQFGKKIFKNLETKPKFLWKLPNGGHINVFHHDHGIYRERFLTLLESLRQR